MRQVSRNLPREFYKRNGALWPSAIRELDIQARKRGFISAPASGADIAWMNLADNAFLFVANGQLVLRESNYATKV